MVDVNLAKDIETMTQEELDSALFKIVKRGDTVATSFSNDGSTPFVQKQINAEDYIRSLWRAGANFSAVDESGHNIQEVAANYGSERALQQLTEEMNLPLDGLRPDKVLIVNAIEHSNLPVAKYIYSKDPSSASYVNNNTGETLAHIAARTLDLETIKFTQNELHVDITAPSYTENVTHIVAKALIPSRSESLPENYNKVLEALKYFHEQGVDLKAKNSDQKTVFDILNGSYFKTLNPNNIEKDKIFKFLKEVGAVSFPQELPKQNASFPQYDKMAIEEQVSLLSAITGQKWLHAPEPADFIYLEIGNNKEFKTALMQVLDSNLSPSIMVHGPIIKNKAEILLIDTQSFMNMPQEEFLQTAYKLADVQSQYSIKLDDVEPKEMQRVSALPKPR